MDSRFTVRTPDEADLPAIVELIFATESAADPAATRYTEDEIRRDWAALSVPDDTWLVLEDGEPVGYATLTPAPASGRLFADGYTRPDRRGQGIGSLLLDRLRARAEVIAAEPAPTRLVLVNFVPLDGASDELVGRHGYELTRVHEHRHLDLAAPTPDPVWPAGVTLRTCDGGDADIRQVHDCVETAFADHWGRPRRSFDEWISLHADPALWWLAEHAGDLVGVSVNELRDKTGEIEQLGVLRAWRRHGLGEALLWHSFADLRSRGAASVVLRVDSASLTGANRLYDRVGMRVSSRVGRFERELRPGLDLLPSS